MHNTRLPRFRRTPDELLSFQLTDRDREIVRLVHRHRFLRSTHIVALVSGSSQQLLRRLALLFHHGYLSRPREQMDQYLRGGSRRMVCGLGPKGAAIIRKETGDASRRSRWNEKNQGLSRLFLAHALLVSDVMVAIELACRRRGVRFIPQHTIVASSPRSPLNWKVNAGGLRLSVIPDQIFAIEYPVAHGATERSYFFLEADRGTMPVIRNSFSQTSFFRKLLAYEATWSQELHKSRFGFHRFRVLTVTKSANRIERMVEACSRLQRARGMFLFADAGVLAKPEDFLSYAWRTAKPDRTTTLLG